MRTGIGLGIVGGGLCLEEWVARKWEAYYSFFGCYGWILMSIEFYVYSAT